MICGVDRVPLLHSHLVLPCPALPLARLDRPPTPPSCLDPTPTGAAAPGLPPLQALQGYAADDQDLLSSQANFEYLQDSGGYAAPSYSPYNASAAYNPPAAGPV